MLIRKFSQTNIVIECLSFQGNLVVMLSDLFLNWKDKQLVSRFDFMWVVILVFLYYLKMGLITNLFFSFRILHFLLFLELIWRSCARFSSSYVAVVGRLLRDIGGTGSSLTHRSVLQRTTPKPCTVCVLNCLHEKMGKIKI